MRERDESGLHRMSASRVALTLETTHEVVLALTRLATTGLFGRTPSIVAEELLRCALREALAKGWGKEREEDSGDRRSHEHERSET
jgi:hypothetical protein